MIDLLLVGPEANTVVPWTLGNVIRGVTSPQNLRSMLSSWLSSTAAEALLCWDPRLGAPDEAHIEAIANQRGDVWHAGLRLGTRGLPYLLDFVAPNWMFNCDPSSDEEATSWRASLSACLVRTTVFRQLGLPCDDFETLAGAMLEWSHRAISRGALMRHVPTLVESARGHGVDWNGEHAIPLSDEMRLIAYRYGRRWARWATTRAAIVGHSPPSELLRAYRHLPHQRPYDEPPPFRPGRSFGDPDLANARVTVVIPTLNRYPYLHKLLENLRAQTVRPLEIIVVDQSPLKKRDPTIATDFADLPLRLMFQDSPGQCVSRNAGLQTATGDYILFIDDDDELSPTLIEDHLRTMATFGADASSGVALNVGVSTLPPEKRFVRASDVFPTGNTLVRRDVLRRTGLFDLAFNRAPRADGELGMRVYLSGAFMVFDPGLAVIHHHASEGGLREHRARVVTYQMSREMLTKRNLPHISEIYLVARYFSERQQRESLWLRGLGTFSARGRLGRRILKALIGAALLPDTLKKISLRKKASISWLEQFPQIDALEQ